MVESTNYINAEFIMQNIYHLSFNRTVSKYNIKEPIELDIVTNQRKIIDSTMNQLIKLTILDKITRIQPIIGEAGTGKSHYYWVLKSMEKLNKRYYKNKTSFRVIYIPSSASSGNIFRHIYSCLINELGDTSFLKRIADTIFCKLKMNLSKKGLKSNRSNIIKQVIENFPARFTDCLKNLLYLKIYGSKKKLGALAIRWFLGEHLTDRELDVLQVNSTPNNEETCFSVLKLISMTNRQVLLFYFDEMESSFRTLDFEERQKFIMSLKRFYGEIKNSVVILACLPSVWGELLKNFNSLLLQMEPELNFDNFAIRDLKDYYIRAMHHFWKRSGRISPKNAYFPFSEQSLEKIYAVGNGNQREIIKKLNFGIKTQLMHILQNRQNKEIF
ncbi:MAG: hypothetical protein ACTSWY_06200 [Promethearchaeota archaeon]